MARKKTAQKPRSKSAKTSSANSRKRGRGRPSDFKPEFCDQAEKLCKLGATDRELADFFEKAESTISLWKTAHPEFSEALKRGKAVADMEVADRLYQRALGYSHASEKVFLFEGQVIRADIVKHYPPDTTAAIFWLKNRQPEKWRDKIDHDHSGKLDLNLDEARDAIEGKLSRIAAQAAKRAAAQGPER